MPSFEFVAVLAATLFTGAALYINFAENPARMECRTVVAATRLRPELPPGGGNAGYTRFAGHRCWHQCLVYWRCLSLYCKEPSCSASWLAGAVLIFAVVPFTLLAIRSTNNQLLDPAADRASDRVRRLLQRWGRLHAVRSLLALASSTVFVASVVWSST
jgi:Domain of unknown function (DUF1772)